MKLTLSALFVVMSTTLAVSAAPLTKDNGAPVTNNQHSLTAGPSGGVLLQDVHLIQKLQRFARERIPERVVHARGTGAHGEFIASTDLSELTAAAPFASSGKVTPVFVRFSTVIHGQGSPETLRDPRGFATKFYSDEGNWDLVGNNLPVFFIRDAIKFPDMVHSLKPSPVTNLQDPNRFFDFFSHEPGSTHMLTQVYSDLGIPASYRQMDGHGVHAYKFINDQGQAHYVKFTWRSQQGVEGLSPAQAAEIQATDFNHLTDDLYAEINAGNYPSWDLYVQVIAPEQLNSFSYNPLDATKTWPDVPAQKVGTMTLNRVPDNFHNATEQVAFAPANLIPGIEPSEDKLLQGRLFAYADTQMYRLGANHQQLPINAPRTVAHNHNQGGSLNHSATTKAVNYQPSQQLNYPDQQTIAAFPTPISGTTQQQIIEKQANFEQAGTFYRSLSKPRQARLIEALAGDLAKVTDKNVQQQMLSHFYKADAEYGQRLTQAVAGNLARVKQQAAQL